MIEILEWIKLEKYEAKSSKIIHRTEPNLNSCALPNDKLFHSSNDISFNLSIEWERSKTTNTEIKRERKRMKSTNNFWSNEKCRSW